MEWALINSFSERCAGPEIAEQAMSPLLTGKGIGNDTPSETSSGVSIPLHPHRLRRFWKLPLLLSKVYSRSVNGSESSCPRLPHPRSAFHLGFGGLVERSALDHHLMTSGFENAEIEFVKRFLKPGNDGDGRLALITTASIRSWPQNSSGRLEE